MNQYLRVLDLTNFLAQIRKIGMDILFPQNIHDKVLICIFIALQKNKCLAHRELIDLVILVNSMTHFGSPETVTKVFMTQDFLITIYRPKFAEYWLYLSMPISSSPRHLTGRLLSWKWFHLLSPFTHFVMHMIII